MTHRIKHLCLRFCLVLGVFAGIIALHFHGLWGQAFGESIWGISRSADPVGVISESFEQILQARLGCGNVVTAHSFPFGHAEPNTFQRFLEPQRHMIRLGYKLFDNMIAGYNFSILGFFALNFFLTFWVVRRWVRHWYVALVPAVLITFSVYAYAHSWAHLGLMPIFVFPVFFVSLCDFYAQKTMRPAIIATLAAAVGLYTFPYYFYFLFVIGLAITLAHLWLVRWRSLNIASLKSIIGPMVVFTAMLIVFMLPFIWDHFFLDYGPYWQSSGTERNYGQDLDMLASFSARPLDYVMSNIHHFIYGDWLAQFITDQTSLRHRYSDELPIYLGIGPLVFAVLVTLMILLSSIPGRVGASIGGGPLRRIRAVFTESFASKRAILVAALVVAVVAFFLSLPPTLEIFGHTLPMPNDFLRLYLPFRSYARLGVVVLTALAIAMSLVIDGTKRPWLWTVLLILLCTFESMPRTYLHPASRDLPYIRFLRERPEKVMMRFEAQNIRVKRAVDLEALLAEKYVVHGLINYAYGMSDWALQKDLPWRFQFGHLADMGIELLVVNGHLNVNSASQPNLEKLAEFPSEGVEIWKILPSGDKRVAGIFKELLEKRKWDVCYVAPKYLVQRLMDTYFVTMRQ